MSSRTKGWLVAASIGAVEAMKDQLGVCRWNYGLRQIQQHAKNSLNKPKLNKPKPNNALRGPSSDQIMKLKRSEESLRTVMFLSSWAPN